MAWSEIRNLCVLCVVIYPASSEPIPLPSFQTMKDNYIGFRHHGGLLTTNRFIDLIGCNRSELLKDSSALRLSYMFNKIGGPHSLGKSSIHLSKYGHDSVTGKDGLQYIFHPIAFGPYLADKYGYPEVSKLHEKDPIATKKTFWGNQGVLRVITYKKVGNEPAGHVALWDCNHFHQTKDWISGHSLLTVEFWKAPDSKCTKMESSIQTNVNEPSRKQEPDIQVLLKQRKWRRKYLKKYYLPAGRRARHHRKHHKDVIKINNTSPPKIPPN